MTDQHVFLGYPLRPDDPSPPAIPPVRLDSFMTIDKADANVTQIKLTSHTGTHVDVPRHCVRGGLSITDFAAGDFVFGSPAVIDLPLTDTEVVQPSHLKPFVGQASACDILLFRFGYGSVRRSDKRRYSEKSPGFGVASARFLREEFPKVRAIGMDVPSLSCIAYLDETFEAHTILLQGSRRKFLVIEDMCLQYDLSSLSEVIVAPLLVGGGDGAPCTVIGKLTQRK